MSVGGCQPVDAEAGVRRVGHARRNALASWTVLLTDCRWHGYGWLLIPAVLFGLTLAEGTFAVLRIERDSEAAVSVWLATQGAGGLPLIVVGHSQNRFGRSGDTGVLANWWCPISRRGHWFLHWKLEWWGYYMVGVSLLGAYQLLAAG